MCTRLRECLTDRSGSVAMVVGVTIVVLLGCAAVALDIAHMVVVKSQLQKAADAGAMAGARGLWPLVLPVLDPSVPRTPNCGAGLTAARTTACNNQVDGRNLTPDSEATVEVGRYDYASRTFTAGCSANTNGVRVTTRRNGVVMLFARILGINTRDLSATAMAVMDFAGAVGKGCLPIALNKDYTVPGTPVKISMNPDQVDNGGWFVDPPDRASAYTFRDYIKNDSCPPLKIGDIINLQNGTDASVLSCLSEEIASNGGYFDTFLPVVNTPTFNQNEPITAFVPFRVQEVSGTGNDKYVKGIVLDLAEMPSALPGGSNFGALAPVKAVF